MKNILGKLFPSNNISTQLYKGKGCKDCNNTGYLGRISIIETINVSPSIAKLIIERATAEDIENQAKSEGLITMIQDGYLKVLDGTTTIEEILRVAKE